LKTNGQRILFLVPYPLGEAPSQRFRFEQYVPVLEERGYRVQVKSFFNADEWKLFYAPGKPFRKITTLFRGFFRRFAVLFHARPFDFIFIHREVAPLGPPVIEWMLAKGLKKRIIYDFDDAIWLTDRKQESPALTMAKWRNKVSSICAWSYKVSCGNHYLQNFSLQFNKNSVFNPTTIDTEGAHNPGHYKVVNSTKNSVVIGWTGSHSTLKYLHQAEGVLRAIEEKYPFTSVRVIADTPPALQLSRLDFVSWNAATEISDLLAIDIGIMPLPDDEWAKGKCGLKGLQYMALGIPAIMAPVGVNKQIITHGRNGFLASEPAEWLRYLSLLIEQPVLRQELGSEGRRHVEKHYSVKSNTANFLALFR